MTIANLYQRIVYPSHLLLIDLLRSFDVLNLRIDIFTTYCVMIEILGLDVRTLMATFRSTAGWITLVVSHLHILTLCQLTLHSHSLPCLSNS